MSWWLIARKDFGDTMRSRMFWGVIGTSLLLMLVLAFSIATADYDAADETLVYELYSTLGSQFVLPLICLVFGYVAIAGERQSGSLRVLLGLAHSRLSILVGKLLSRAAVVLFAGLLTLAATVLIVLALFDSLGLRTFLEFAALTALLLLAFVGLAVGISAAVATRTRAMAAAVGSYVLFFFLWYPLVAALHYAIEGDVAGYDLPDWYLFALMVNPLEAYREAVGQSTGRYVDHVLGWNTVVEDIDIALGSLRLEDRAAATEVRPDNGLPELVGDVPAFVSVWFAALVLVLWFLVPVVVGYVRFERASLD